MIKKKKKIYTGYIGKWYFDDGGHIKLFEETSVSYTDRACKVILPRDIFPEIFTTRGNKKEWENKDWPPKKIKITIELVD